IEHMKMPLARLDGADHQKARAGRESSEISGGFPWQAQRWGRLVDIGAVVKPADAERPLARRPPDIRPIPEISSNRSGAAQRAIHFENRAQPLFVILIACRRKILGSAQRQ